MAERSEGEIGPPGPRIRPDESREQVASKFDLSLDLSELRGRIVGGLTYATALFKRETAERYVGYLRQVLEGLVSAETDDPVDGITLLPAEERRRVVEEWNATEAEYPRERCVQELFEEQVRQSPDAVAVVYEGSALSYGEWNRRANRLAHYLKGGEWGRTREWGCVWSGAWR